MRRSDVFRAVYGLLLLVSLILHLLYGKSAAGLVTFALAAGCVYIAGAILARSTGKPSVPGKKPKTEVSFPRVLQKQAAEEVEPVDPAAVLGRAHRKESWAKTERQIDSLLDAGIALVRLRIDAFTVAVFFPTLDGGYQLRRWQSPSEHINEKAVIYPGVGVIGSFLKGGLKQLNLKEIISDSMTLYYYTKDTGIRSLMASPICADGIDRGTIIVDSTDPKHFNDADHKFLSSVAAVLGQAVYSSYMYTEHKLQHGRLAAMSSIEKEFFRNLSRKGIIDKIVEIVPFALPCDRLTISMRNEGGNSATMYAAIGADAEAFSAMSFPLKEKSLAAVLYSKNLMLSRNYSEEHYEVRYRSEEPRNGELLSFVVVPLGIDECKGMLLLESVKKDVYDDSYRELLGRLGTSAGLAIEKMLVFEKANALATHDGLTGLNNHRTFQQILADEITRAIRYKEPVALVICDIDYFKKVNDTYGHPFGDVVLKGVADLLEKSIRQDIDCVARYGGEEFALILVKTDDTGAAETAERIRSAIAATAFNAPGGVKVSVTMSFGIAEYRKHARQINELIAKADKALYRAKKDGRNRVEVF
jgi:diguanylate cyclase (GGDEF)-like protein